MQYDFNSSATPQWTAQVPVLGRNTPDAVTSPNELAALEGALAVTVLGAGATITQARLQGVILNGAFFGTKDMTAKDAAGTFKVTRQIQNPLQAAAGPAQVVSNLAPKPTITPAASPAGAAN
jgi:hypothetical protein